MRISNALRRWWAAHRTTNEGENVVVAPRDDARRARALPFVSAADVDAALPEIVAHLGRGGVIVCPTETLYGFASGTGHEALATLQRIKPRPKDQPFLVLVDGLARVRALGLRMNAPASALASAFWPGALTLVLACGDTDVPDALRGPSGGVAVRWTSHAGARAIVRALGAPITSTSTNPPGLPPVTSVAEIERQWDREIARGELLVLDAGNLPPRAASTVVDCTGARPALVRRGAIGFDALREVVPELGGDA